MPLTYQHTIEYLYAKLPMFSRTGKAALKPGLDNTLALLDALGNPQEKFRSVHIAGTNGKGSVSHGLAAILQNKEYRTGLYTSPHLVDMRERIRINGREVSESFIIDFTERIRPLVDAIQPSFFEILVAAAFVTFAEEGVDIAVIETGLGGRLDSTNVITPLLSVITNIGLDHTDLLGDTLELIAAEKAGIIKAGIPVVIGRKQPETEPLFCRTAVSLGSSISFAEDHFTVRREERGTESTFQILEQPGGREYVLTTDLRGHYQAENIRTILSAASVLGLQGFDLPLQDSLDALRSVGSATGLRGRYEVLQQHPLVVADVAHNKDGLEPVLRQFTGTKANRYHIVAGFVRDKDVAAALALLPSDVCYYWCNADLPRALPAAELAQMAKAAGLSGEAYASVSAAVGAALAACSGEDAVLITGSFFIVGEALDAIQQ